MQVIFLIVYFFEAIIAYIYFSDSFKRKKSAAITFLILISLYAAAFLINLFFSNITYLNAFVFFVINALFALSCFNTTLKAGIFHSVFLTAIMFVTELIPQAALSYLADIPIDAYRKDLSVLVILGIISKTFYLLVSKILSYFFSYKKGSEISDKMSTPLFLYPVIISLTLLLVLYASTRYGFSKELNLIFAVVSIFSLLFCCFIFIYNQRVQKQQEELVNLQAIRQRDEMNTSFYGLLEKKNEEQRVLAHDIKHHFYAIDAMDNISDVKKYIEAILPELEKYQYIGNTKNKMLDLILNKYYLIAKSENITFKSDTRASNLSFIEDSDLVSMLGNLLDNAFESAVNSEEKQVFLTTTNEKSFVILNLVNSCNSTPLNENNKLVTSKSDKKHHGYGTKSIEKTAGKYNAVCQWNYDGINKKFHYSVLFNIE